MGKRSLGTIQLDLPGVEITIGQALAHLFARAQPAFVRLGVVLSALAAVAARRRGQEQSEQTVLSKLLCLLLDGLGALGLDHCDGDVHQIADDGLDVTAHVADFGVLRGLNFREGSIREVCQSARDLRLADARGPDHDDVVGHDLVAELVGHLESAPTVAQGNGHSFLGAVLPDDVAVELAHDRLGGQRCHGVTCASQGLLVGLWQQNVVRNGGAHSEFLDDKRVIGEHTDGRGNLQGLLDDSARLEVGHDIG